MRALECTYKWRLSCSFCITRLVQLMLTVMREVFDNLNRQLSATSASTANAITKAFETLKGELKIAHEEESEQESARNRRP